MSRKRKRKKALKELTIRVKIKVKTVTRVAQRLLKVRTKKYYRTWKVSLHNKKTQISKWRKISGRTSLLLWWHPSHSQRNSSTNWFRKISRKVCERRAKKVFINQFASKRFPSSKRREFKTLQDRTETRRILPRY